MNRLQFEKSPYLLQHADNPVDWLPWGEAAFQRAKDGDRPVFLSIGYAACHWCHVMARESFADPEAAATPWTPWRRWNDGGARRIYWGQAGGRPLIRRCGTAPHPPPSGAPSPQGEGLGVR